MRTLLCNLILAFFIVFTFDAAALTRYVDLNSPNPMPPYTSWAIAATNIQDAIDAADAGDLILVTNGVYSAGGRVVHGAVTNRVALIRPVTVQSVNGPANTIILGGGSGLVRCAYLTNDAVLAGFTLTNGVVANGGDMAQENAGGGVWGEGTNAVVSDCIIIGNSANYLGGGAYFCTLTNCNLLNNFAAYNGGGVHGGVLYDSSLANNYAGWGGGADGSTLIGCVLTNNSGSSGGGASYSTLSNCLIIANHSSSRGGGVFESTLQACKLINNTTTESGGGARKCTLQNCLVVGNYAGDGGGVKECTLNNCTVVNNTSIGIGGAANSFLNNSIIISNSGTAALNYNTYGFYGDNVNFCITTPLPPYGIGNLDSFSGFADFIVGDFRLPSNSPCINAGKDIYASDTTDLAGNPRIAGDRVDVGAYEYESPTSVLSYAWAQKYGLTIDGSSDFSDTDSDGMNNYQEWSSGTVPTNALSVLKITSASNSSSSIGIDITWPSVPTRSYWLERSTNLDIGRLFETIGTNIGGLTGMQTFTDVSATNGGPYFYRVGVEKAETSNIFRW